MIIKLDNKDKKILALLQLNSKMNIKEIAAKVRLTVTPTYERIKRLEKSGIIASYKAVLDKKKINKLLEVFCHVTLSLHSKIVIKTFEKEVVKIDDVLECYHVTGNADYLLKVLVSDMDEYQDFIINKLSALENVSNVQSTFVMTSVKSNTAIKI